ncbi:hypothetical protein LPAF129_04000 [Ligilactobacillus pabuli]|uniref:Uncharacterized protein n=1 Tax=Ligilactobacillus pabuli TaxID=2886039 RepID=A0ABQ5JIA5_9LACO|nr:hypothetical protein [Ligilactobacillus pabuli]GKS80715.1 hypothetical protein LPAF129_04000 [Ligilactobacillus pabuli]
MSKYYRVRTQEQWNWLMEHLELEYPFSSTTFLTDSIFMDFKDAHQLVPKISIKSSNINKIIEVSQMMEDEKMEDYVTIHSEDLEKIKVDYGQMNDVSLINHDVDGKMYIHERFLPADLMVPKSLLYPKIKLTPAEKAEFDSIDNDETLYNALDIIEREDYPHLYKRIYEHAIMSIPKFELEFARAWADPDLIEVLPEKKWNVRVPKLKNMFYWKNDDETLDYQDSQYNCYHHQQFTAEELKHYGLDNDLFEKVEVSE